MKKWNDFFVSLIGQTKNFLAGKMVHCGLKSSTFEAKLQIKDLLWLWNQVWLKIFIKSPRYWNFIYQTNKNFGGNVSTKSCSDHIFTNKSDFSTPAFVSKTFLCAIFLKNSYSVTPIIFWLLYKKISFSELNEDIFYKQPVFTATLQGSQLVSLRGPNL